MGYQPSRTFELWLASARQKASLGVKAIEDAVRDIAGYEGIEVVSCIVTPLRDGRVFNIEIAHRDVDSDPKRTLQLTTFDVFNFR